MTDIIYEMNDPLEEEFEGEWFEDEDDYLEPDFDGHEDDWVVPYWEDDCYEDDDEEGMI